MKKYLQIVFATNRKQWEVWSYLFLMSSRSHVIHFTYNELGAMFGMSKSSIHRAINDWIIVFNDKKIFVELTKENKVYELKFYPAGKKAPNFEKETLNSQLYEFLEQFYQDHDYDYPTLPRHRAQMSSIMKKIERAMKARGTDLTNDSRIESFKLFFNNLPEWWVQHNMSLPSLNKNFENVLAKIKNGNNGNKFARAYQQAASADFSELADN